MSLTRVFLVVSVLLLSTQICFGQTLGTVTGQVKDSSGAAVRGATVTLTDKSTNSVRMDTTNSDGIYSFPALIPGHYALQVKMGGFATVNEPNIDVQVQQTVRSDVTLQPGQVNESIEVSALAEQLNTDNATVGTVIENRRIVELPLNGRDYLQLVQLSPNVTASFGSAQSTNRQGGTRATENMSIAGGRSTFNHYTLDGIENTDVNFNLYLFQPSIDAIQEFKIQSGYIRRSSAVKPHR